MKRKNDLDGVKMRVDKNALNTAIDFHNSLCKNQNDKITINYLSVLLCDELSKEYTKDTANMRKVLNGDRVIHEEELKVLAEILNLPESALIVQEDKCNKFADMVKIFNCVDGIEEIDDFSIVHNNNNTGNIEFTITYDGKKKSYNDLEKRYKRIKKVAKF